LGSRRLFLLVKADGASSLIDERQGTTSVQNETSIKAKEGMLYSFAIKRNWFEFMNTWNALIVAFVVTAALSDAYTKRIPRVLTTSGVLAGLLFHAFAGGLGSSVAAMLIGFAVALTFFWIGAIAGGDVKLIAALGSMLGLERWALAMEIAVFAAALIGLVQVLRSGALIRTLNNIWQIVVSFTRNGVKPIPAFHAGNPSGIRSPFGVAAALGTVVAMVVR
jgi:prepilin peptidase CpaA